MPPQARNQRAEDSPPLSMRNKVSAPHPDGRTHAFRRNARRSLNRHASLIPTDGRNSGGDRTAPRTAQSPAPTAGRLAELCSECECYLRPEEIETNERDATSANRRGESPKLPKLATPDEGDTNTTEPMAQATPVAPRRVRFDTTRWPFTSRRGRPRRR